MFWERNKKVTVAYTFLLQSDAATKGVFRVIQERPIPSECSMSSLPDGKVLVRITREIENNTVTIMASKDELVSDLRGYGAIFQYWKYHLVSSNGSLRNKNIALSSKFLAWLTPAADARNYEKHWMPYYSIVLVLIVGFIMVCLV